jgi:hypothetical protein
MFLLRIPTTISWKKPAFAKATMEAPALGAAICVGSIAVKIRCSCT